MLPTSRRKFSSRPAQVLEAAARQAQRMARMAVMAAQVAAQAKPGVTMAGGTSGQSIDKREYIVSPLLMTRYRLIPCQHCGVSDGTVCGAHSNWGIHGKGGAIKADDSRCASLCRRCHIDILDQGARLSKLERKLMWWLAHVRTVRELVCRELWPASVPVPATDACPWEEA